MNGLKLHSDYMVKITLRFLAALSLRVHHSEQYPQFLLARGLPASLLPFLSDAPTWNIYRKQMY